MAGRPDELLTVMYHYVRDVRETRFPDLKAVSIDDFRAKVDHLASHYEMADLESALAFLSGAYQPERQLCLLTFDDGLADHYDQVTPILVERNVQGVFFLTTGCIEDGFVLPVHMNHFLMAHLGLDDYRRKFLQTLYQLQPDVDGTVDDGRARQTYRWDEPDVATFKYLVNYHLVPEVRNQVLADLFSRVLGPEEVFASDMYLSWSQAEEMRVAGMALGGHTHTHPVLSACNGTKQQQEIESCSELLRRRLGCQTALPFAYPYGKLSTFDTTSVDLLRTNGFACAFSTEIGSARGGDDSYAIPRVDPKDL